MIFHNFSGSLHILRGTDIILIQIYKIDKTSKNHWHYLQLHWQLLDFYNKPITAFLHLRVMQMFCNCLNCFSFSPSRPLDGPTDVLCLTKCCCRCVWPVPLKTLNKRYVRNVYYNMKFCVWKYDMPCASKKIIMVEVSGYVSEHLNVIKVYMVINIHPKAGISYEMLSMFSAMKT